MEWSNGRELTHAEDAAGTYDLDYTYDMNGLRTSKEVNGVTHTYIYAGGKLIRETYGDTVMDFVYDRNGYPYALYYNGTKYLYRTNLMGDVLAIIDGDGKITATYNYDAWGKVISAPTSGVGADNPLRYCGYYYDTETGFYYLQSRYYDPEICRFINADAYASTGQDVVGYNMFAYCNNNPINCVDSTGDLAVAASVGTIVAMAAVSGIAGAVSTLATGGTWKDAKKELFLGAAEGAIVTAFPGTIGFFFCFNVIKTWLECINSEVDPLTSVAYGLLSGVGSLGLPETGDDALDVLVAATFGFGETMSLGAINASAQNQARENHYIPSPSVVHLDYSGKSGPVNNRVFLLN